MEEIIQKDSLSFPEILWERPVHYYKAQGGKVFVLAGSKGMSGAAALTCEAAFRSGTGILTLGFPDVLKEVYKEMLPEAMTLELPSTPSGSVAQRAKEMILEHLKGCDACILGPGLSTNAETVQLIWELLFEIEIPTVLDADGINALAKGLEVMRSKETLDYLEEYFKKIKPPLIITPHAGEAEKAIKAIRDEKSFLKNINAKYIDAHKKDIAPKIAEMLGVMVVLKGHDTVVVDNKGRMLLNRVGGPELATAGSGDVLSGMVGSFIAQNPEKIFEAVSTAVYLHGKSGEIAKENIGERSVIASDIIRYLPEAIKKTEEI